MPWAAPRRWPRSPSASTTTDAGGDRGLRTGQPRHRPRQHLRRRRQALPQGRHRHRLRGRPDRDRRSSPTTPPCPRTSLPTSSSQAEHDPQAASVLVTDSVALADAVRADLERPGGGHQALRAGPRGAHRTAVGGGPGRRPRRRASRSSTPTPPSTSRSRWPTPPRSPRGSATPARSSSARTRRSAWATTSPGSNHVLPTGGCACHSSGLSVQSFLRGMHVVDLLRGRAARRWPTTWSRSRRPRTCPPTARRSRSASTTGRDPADDRRLDNGALDAPAARRPARRERLTAHRSSTSPSGSTPTRTPTPCRPTRRRRDHRGGGRGGGRPEPLPRPRVHRAARRRSRHTCSRRGAASTPAQVWAGNGSNEVLQHVVLAFGGPGRTALGFTPAYSMHPIISARSACTWVDGLRGRAARAFDLDAESAVAAGARARPPRRLPLLAQQPDRHRPGPRRRRGRVRRGGARPSSSWTRRTPSSPAPGHPAR